MRFHRTIKFRLTVWYVIILTVVLLFFSFITYLLLARDIYPTEAASTHVSVFKLKPAPVGANTSPAPSNQADSFQPLPGYSVTKERLEEIRAKSVSPFEIIRPEGLFSLDQKAFFAPEMEGPLDVRLYYRPISAEPGFYDVLVVTQSKAQPVSILLAYREVLFVAIPLTLVLAGALGYFLIWRMLQPIEAIGRMVGAIREDSSVGIHVKSEADEVQNLSAALNRTFARLQSAVEHERQFTSDVSHELRAPLAIMQSEASLALSRTRSAQEYQSHLEEISKEISHMSSVVAKLRFLARADAGQEKLSFSAVSLRGILDDLAAVTQSLVQEQGLSLKLDSPYDFVVPGDETKLREVFLNLLDNAIKYTPRGGAINVSLMCQDGQAMVAVRDTGIGIAAEHLPHIFERFYRVDGHLSDDDGSGLGLTICNEIVKLHGGKISAESTAGQGSTFTVVLPATPPVR